MLVVGDIAAVLERVTRALDSAGVPNAVGGSVGSGIWGIPRSTNGADLVADVRPEHIDAIIEHLGEEFYADREMVAEAVRRRSSFNLIHYDLAVKVDVFVCGSDASMSAQLARRVRHTTAQGVAIEVASAEDVIVAKLRWYRMGGEVSERQWRDVLEVLAVRGPRLDAAYLDATAHELGVADLLAKAREEAARGVDSCM